MKLSLLLLLAITTVDMPKKKLQMLCLGDSYTIGEAVSPEERFSHQTIALLNKDGIRFTAPLIVAKTGWTTDELAAAIEEKNIQGTFDAVTLLIGVNNQYRNRNTDNYQMEFEKLLQTAIRFAGNHPQHVFVLSIPDWGVTPFAKKDPRSEQTIAMQIDTYNEVNRQASRQAGVHYIDITPDSRKAKQDVSLLADDGLHPSGKQYKVWADALYRKMKPIYDGTSAR